PSLRARVRTPGARSHRRRRYRYWSSTGRQSARRRRSQSCRPSPAWKSSEPCPCVAVARLFEGEARYLDLDVRGEVDLPVFVGQPHELGIADDERERRPAMDRLCAACRIELGNESLAVAAADLDPGSAVELEHDSAPVACD